MRAKNVLIFLTPALLSILVIYLVGLRNPAVIFGYFVILDVVISLFFSALFLFYWKKGKNYDEFLRNYLENIPEVKGKVAVVIPVYNEDPWRVVQTAIAAKMAAPTAVFVLDDSTDEKIRKELDKYAKEYGFQIFRGDKRMGFKAGAINAWLEKYGDEYDFLTILDADQRPFPSFFKYTLGFFKDEKVVFVQVPQYYSRVNSIVSLSAYIQLIPFLRTIMRARHMNQSAFSLGSGTIYRIKALKEIGGLYEKTVTEDIYTSLLLHERGYKSQYLDLPLVWHGEAPENIRAYWIQQNRWAYGGFQTLRKLLNAKMSFVQILDYLNGVFYWTHVGILSLVDILAPILFLIFGIYFIGVHPLLYLGVYGSIFTLSLIFYITSMRRYGYGLREYIYHQGIQFIALYPAMLAFFQWLFRRKKSFSVTPKNKEKKDKKYAWYFLSVIVILIFSVAYGSSKVFYTHSLLYPVLINIFWALWWVVISSSALYISLSPKVKEKDKRRIKQSYKGLERPVVDMLYCGIKFEKLIGEYYTELSKKYGEYSKTLSKIAKDSFKHAYIYSQILKNAEKKFKIRAKRGCVGMEEYLNSIEKKVRKGCDGKELKDCLMPQEEIYMYVYSSLVLETCVYISKEMHKEVREIMYDELEHDKLVREMSS